MINQAINESDIIKSFYIPGEEGISEYWRRNKSPVEFRELVNLLRGIHKVTSYMGRNVDEIIWYGMDPSEESTIILDPSIVMGKYPVPANKTDVAIGMAIHEAFNRIEWSERTKTICARALGKELYDEDSYNYDRRFMHFVTMAEQVYLDTVANRSIFGLYVEKYRQFMFDRNKKYFVQPPTVDELCHLWWLMAADLSGQRYKEEFKNEMYGFYGYNLEQFYKEPLRIMNSIVEDLIESCRNINSVVDRCEYRAKLYLSIWPQLMITLRFWVTDIRDKKVIPRVVAEEVIEDKEEFKAIIAQYAREIECIVSKNVDLTDEIRLICQDDEEIVPLEVSDIVLPLNEQLNMNLLQRVQTILKSRAERRKNVSRGMKSGKIDKRRLYRAPINGNVFLYKKNEFEINNDIILIVDASGSMGGPKWKMIQMLFKVLYTALFNLNKNVRLFAYNDAKGTCFITELSRGDDEVFTVLPQGKTASGEAIIAAVMLLKRKNKRPFIIHITDGASNWGISVKHAIEYCRKKKVNLMTLGFGCSKSNKAALREEYGKQVEFIDNLEEFPQKFGKLLTHGKYMTG